MKNIYILSIFSCLFLFTACGDDDPVVTPDPTVTSSNFIGSIDENSASGTVIGTVSATTTDGTLAYTLSNVTPAGALAINSSTGELTVDDASAFDFETNTEINAQFTASVGSVSSSAEIAIAINDIDESPVKEIWTGATMTFTKANNTDPTVEANQDRISDEVWLTRGIGNDKGQIYNIKVETISDKDNSPVGTEWAFGTTADIDNLSFGTFRGSLGKPQDNLDKDLVLRLVEENIYIDVKFTQWSTGGAGGFAYERSTK